MENQIGSGTAKGLIEFLDQLVQKGRATGGSILPLKSTVRQVLAAVDGNDKWDSTDMRKLDVEDYINRFKNKTMGKYNEASYITYKSRLAKAVDWYNKFLVQPGWVPTKSPTSKPKKTEGKPVAPTVEKTPTESPTVPDRPVDKDKQDLIAYPFPLRAGKVVYLYLPSDITKSEATRLSNYLTSLCVETE
jgi:hypothetical protein